MVQFSSPTMASYLSHFVLLCVYVTLVPVMSQRYDCRGPPSPAPWTFLPFGEQVGDEVLEEKSAELNLNVKFPFQQGSYDTIYVNADGVISFLRPFTQATPTRLPLGGTARVPMLAPYWANVDLSANNGQVYFRQATAARTLNRAYDLMRNYYRDVSSGSMSNFRPSLVVIVTWQNVTFAGGSCTTPVNSFQVVMLTNGRHSYAFYLYGDMAWTSSSRSGGNSQGLGGTAALVGYASGEVGNNLMVNCSLRACIRTWVKTETNTRYNGIWVFRLENKPVQDYGCMQSGPATIVNNAGPVLGGMPFQLTGPCLRQVQTPNIRCRIGQTVVNGRKLYDPSNNFYMVQCIPPLTLKAGPVPVGLSIDRGRTYPFTAKYYYMFDYFLLTQVDDPSWEIATTEGVLTWDTTILPATSVIIEYLVMFPDDRGDNVTFESVELFNNDTRNRPGYAKLPLGLPLITKMPTLTSLIILRVYDQQKLYSQDKVILYSSPQWSLYFFNQWMIELAYRTLRRITFGRTAESVRDWAKLEPYLTTPEAWRYLGSNPDRLILAKFIADGNLDNFYKTFYTRLCRRWKTNDSANPQQLTAALPRVPCTVDDLVRDGGFDPDLTCGLDDQAQGRCRFRPKADTCMIAADATSQGYGQRACYDTSGRLITSSSDSQSAGNSQLYYKGRWFDNMFYDARGQAHCCVFSDNCKIWSEQRPASTCTRRSDMTTPRSSNGNQGTPGPRLQLDFTKGPVMGGNPVYITLRSPAFSADCRFGKVLVEAVMESATKARCMAPLSFAAIAVPVQVSVDGGRTFLPATSSYEYDPLDKSYTLKRGDLKIWEDVNQRPYIMWDTNIFNPSYVNIDFVEFFPGQEPSSPPAQEAVPLVISTPTRQSQVQLPLGLRFIRKMPTLTTFGALRLYDSGKQNQPSRTTLWSDPFWSLWFYNQYLVELIYRQSTRTPVQMTSEATTIWRSLQPLLRGTYIRSREDAMRFVASGKLSSYNIGAFNALCSSWNAAEARDPPNFSDLPAVPCTPDDALKDSTYDMDPLCQSGKPCLFRPEANVCFIANKPSSNLHGQRVCYDMFNKLIIDSSNGSAGSSMRWFPPVNWFQHQFFDQRGNMHCCVWGRSCYKFSRYRPARDCNGYSPESSTDAAKLAWIAVALVVPVIFVIIFLVRSASSPT